MLADDKTSWLLSASLRSINSILRGSEVDFLRGVCTGTTLWPSFCRHAMMSSDETPRCMLRNTILYGRSSDDDEIRILFLEKATCRGIRGVAQNSAVY